MRYMKSHISLAITAALATTSGISSQAFAQQEESKSALETIEVTARKRVESIQDVPIAVTAISAAAIESRQINAIDDIGRSVPNLITTPSSGSPTNTRVFLRGLGQGESTQPTAEAAVGMYIDDVYVARLNGANMQLFDIERIEVLRGPQGTLYGRNSTTGAIKIVTNKPDGESEVKARISVGDRQLFNARLRAQTAVSDDWAIGASMSYSTQDGYVDRYDKDTSEKIESDLNQQELFGVNLALSRTANDGFNADFSLYYSDDKGDASYITPVDNTGKPLINGDIYATYTSTPQYATAEQFGASANLSWDLSNGTQLKSISAYRHVDNTGLIDISGKDSWLIESDVSNYQVSQELQWLGDALEGKIDWFLGAFWLYEKSDSYSLNTISSIIQSAQDYQVDTSSYALFGQSTYHLSDALDVTLGLRYTLDDKHFDGTTTSNILFTSGANELSRDFDAITHALSLNYDLADDVMIYASWSTGFKAGGFQGRAFNAQDQLEVYDAEDVTTWETGLKSQWLDDSLRFNATYFYNDFENLQLNSLNPDGGGTIIQNAAKAKLDGVELELTYYPLPDLSIYVNHATAWGEYKSLTDTVASITLDSELTATPTANTKMGVEYFVSLSSGELSFGADFQHTSRYNPGAATSPNVAVPRVDIFNGFIKYTAQSGNWDVALYGLNLTDKAYNYTGFTFSSFEAVYAAAPRTIKASFSYHF